MPRGVEFPTREDLWIRTASSLRAAGRYTIVTVGDDNDPPDHISRDSDHIIAISNDTPARSCAVRPFKSASSAATAISNPATPSFVRAPAFVQNAGGAVLYCGGTEPRHRTFPHRDPTLSSVISP